MRLQQLIKLGQPVTQSLLRALDLSGQDPQSWPGSTPWCAARKYFPSWQASALFSPSLRPKVPSIRMWGVCLWSCYLHPSVPCTCSTWTPCPEAETPLEGSWQKFMAVNFQPISNPFFTHKILNGTPTDKAKKIGAAPIWVGTGDARIPFLSQDALLGTQFKNHCHSCKTPEFKVRTPRF